jgi:hypothetical protein
VDDGWKICACNNLRMRRSLMAVVLSPSASSSIFMFGDLSARLKQTKWLSSDQAGIFFSIISKIMYNMLQLLLLAYNH